MPRHHKSRLRLGQGSEVREDAFVRKRHVSTIRGVGGSRVDVFAVPGRCDVRFRCRSVSVFQTWTCVDAVVGDVDHFARNYDGGGCGTWSGVYAGRPFRACFFFSILVRGDISGVPRSNYDSGGCSTWSGVCAGRPFRAYLFFFSILVRGDISGVPRSIDRNRATTSTDRYGSVYSCTAGSGGICIVGRVPARAAGDRG